jgi:hypothetical protein
MSDIVVRIEQVPFRDITLSAYQFENGDVYVSIRSLCEHLGINQHIVASEVARNPERFEAIRKKTSFVMQGTTSVNVLQVHYQDIPMFFNMLGDFVPKKGPVRELWLAVCQESSQALSNYFYRGVAVNPRIDIVTLGLEMLKYCRPTLELQELEDRDVVLLKDLARNIINGSNSPFTLSVSISEQCRVLGYKGSTNNDWIAIGQIASNKYLKKYGERPPKHKTESVGGGTRPVGTYYPDDLEDVVNPAIHEYFAKKGQAPKLKKKDK